MPPANAFSWPGQSSLAKRGEQSSLGLSGSNFAHALKSSGGSEEQSSIGIRRSRLKVVKVGGSCLEKPEYLDEIADQFAELVLSGYKLVIVVSAMKGETDKLLEEARLLGITDPAKLDAHIAQGEMNSAKALARILEFGHGVPSHAVLPGSKHWSIKTDARFGDANPLIEETRERTIESMSNLLNSVSVAVVCGFLGETLEGEITTLGRGGSDATALLLGNVLRASEVVLVKDVDGMYNCDPRKNKHAERIPKMTAVEAYEMAKNGAKVVQPKALELKSSDVDLRIVGNGSGKGTIITGAVDLGMGVLA